MNSFTIKGNIREGAGKKDSKQLRKNDFIPCVLYGGGENIHFSVYDKDLRHLVYTDKVYLVDLEIAGKTYKSIMKDIQFHPVSDRILHIDFQQIFEDKKITLSLPVHLTGAAEGVKAGGKLKHEMRLLKVKAFYKDMPDFIEVNIEKLEIGKSIRIADLDVPKVEFMDFKNLAVVSVRSTRTAVVEQPTE